MMQQFFPGGARAAACVVSFTGLALCAPAALAQHGIHSPVSSAQRATAQQVAVRGVPLSELAPDAPDEYTVRRGDTLWGISGKYLKSPWRWPELWGMNLREIRNPNLIYPGQQLFLERVGGRAYLRTADRGGPGPMVRVSPRNRVEALNASPIPTLDFNLIGPFLTEPLVVDDDTFERAPRLVALSDDSRVLIADGDRAYALGPEDAPLLRGPGTSTDFRIFRTATPLKDPTTGEILGYEGQYVGQGRLVRGQSETDENVAGAPPAVPAGGPVAGEQAIPAQPQASAASDRTIPVPATVDIVSSKEEIRPGDRLIPEPPPEFDNYVPHAPAIPVDAQVVSVYGNAVRFAGGNQVVAINKGAADGIESGQVLAVLSAGRRVVDRTGGERQLIQLPDERNGLALVFKPFERVSYVLVTEVGRPVQVGDRLTNPR